MASSSVLKRSGGAPGPKVSSLVMTMSVVTSVKTVGSKKLPPCAARLPPVMTLAPYLTASAMCASTFSAVERLSTASTPANYQLHFVARHSGEHEAMPLDFVFAAKAIGSPIAEFLLKHFLGEGAEAAGK